jgi:hypothetical protein
VNTITDPKPADSKIPKQKPTESKVDWAKRVLGGLNKEADEEGWKP